MGLRAQFSMDDLGYAAATEELGIPIDYSDGCSVFADTFEKVAKGLVPVDTGNLRSSISASSFGDGCECDASADYAQYVEYGTYKMDAQPYFEPALEAAYAEASVAWQEAINIAQMEEEEQLEELERQQAGRAGRSSPQQRLQQTVMGSMRSFGSFLGMILGAIIVGLVQGFLNLISGRSGGSSRRGGSGDLGGDFNIDVEIY